MNEIKKIHLGRQPFTIAVDAHKLLRSYLEAIEQQVGPKSEVIKEVELRMAELLAERGITGEKVVLEDDVAFLKEQLGEPGDFKDEDHEAGKSEAEQPQKRLFRNTANGMIAGVCSGIAAYFGVDVTIVRLIFVAALLLGGAAIPIYIVLWLVMPEAKTPSDRLQMQGKAVTVDSLKELVDRADVKGAADRASKTVGPFFERLVRLLSSVAGLFIIVAAATLFVALTTVLVYLFFHRHDLVGQAIAFPVGSSETTLTIMSALTAGILSLLTLLIGVAMIRRKWLIPGWVTASLIGLVLVAGAVGTAVGPDAVYSVRDRYRAAEHTLIQSVKPFTSVQLKGHNVDYVYEQSDTYSVGTRYVGKNKPKKLKTSFSMDGLLTIDAGQIGNHFCNGICIARGEFYEVVIRAPKLDKVITDGGATTLYRIQPGEHFTTLDYDY